LGSRFPGGQLHELLLLQKVQCDNSEGMWGESVVLVESPSADTFIIIFISFFFIIILSAPLPVLWKGLLQELHEVQPFHPKIRLHQARKGLQQLQPPPQWPIFTVRRRRSCRVAFQIPEAQLLKQFRSE